MRSSASADRRRVLAALALPLLPARLHAQSTTMRLIAIGGMVTEIVYALGMESTLVGADTTSIYPEAAARLPKVGYQRTLSAEGVLSLRPTMIIAAGEAGPAAALQQLRAAKVAVHVLEVSYAMQGVRNRIATVGRLLQVPARAQALDAQLMRDWEVTEREVRRYTSHPRVVFVLAHSPNNTMVAGKDTAADAMIGLAGAINVMSTFRGYRPLNAEALAAADPEVLLLTTQGLETAGGPDALWRKPGMALTTAGRHGRLAHLDALYLLGFGPRLPPAVRDLAAAIRDERHSA